MSITPHFDMLRHAIKKSASPLGFWVFGSNNSGRRFTGNLFSTWVSATRKNLKFKNGSALTISLLRASYGS